MSKYKKYNVNFLNKFHNTKSKWDRIIWHTCMCLINRRFFVKSTLPISEEIRRDVGRHVKETQGSDQRQESVFDVAQAEVERLINNTTYSNFLKSDMYLHYVQVSTATVLTHIYMCICIVYTISNQSASVLGYAKHRQQWVQQRLWFEQFQ